MNIARDLLQTMVPKYMFIDTAKLSKMSKVQKMRHRRTFCYCFHKKPLVGFSYTLLRTSAIKNKILLCYQLYQALIYTNAVWYLRVKYALPW